MLISIIIPIYKVESYIIRCIESVLNQTYRQLEVILVDDCSPDRSMVLAKQHIQTSQKSQDLKFLFLKHNNNRGQAAARNTGIKAANGDYIYFLDSDDEIPNDSISTLVAASENGTIDVVSADVKVFQDNATHHFYNADYYYTCNYDIVKAFVGGKLLMMAGNFFVRRRLVTRGIWFKEGIIYEDELWSFTLLNNASTLKSIARCTYNYYIRANSTMTGSSTEKRYNSLLVIIEEMVILFKSKGIPSYKENLEYIQYKRLIWTMTILKSQLSLREKIQYFKRLYTLPIGGNRTFILGIIRSIMIVMLYPIRRRLSIWIK